MKRVGFVGSGLLGALAASMLVAAGATAAEPITALPQLGRCVAVPTGTGEWEGAHCQTFATNGKGDHNWLQGPGPHPGFTAEMEGLLEGAQIKLETKDSKHLLECQAATITGEFTGVKSKKESVHLIGCTLAATAQRCHSGQNPLEETEINFSAEEASLGFINSKLRLPRVGWDLKPISVEITCGVPPETNISKDTLEGSVIGRVVKVGSMGTEFTETYNATGGIQKPVRFEGGATDVLTSKFTGPMLEKSEEQTGLVAKVKVTPSEPLEIKVKCIKEAAPCT